MITRFDTFDSDWKVSSILDIISAITMVIKNVAVKRGEMVLSGKWKAKV